MPADTFDRGPWWTLFGDPDLSRLEVEVAAHNQTLIAAEQAYSQSRALVAEARASFFPTVTLDPTFIELGGGGVSSSFIVSQSSGLGSGASSSLSSGLSSGLSSSAPSSPDPAATSPKTFRIYELVLGETWAPDVWGKVRRQVEAAGANAQASAANVANVRLSLQTELASDYLQLRATDEELRLYDQTVKDYQLTLNVLKTQYNVGTAAQDVIDQAAAQLYAAQSQAAALRQSRQQFEHAIAVLIGEPPANLSLAAKPFAPKVPDVPAGMPTALLQRRPDIAQAERLMKAANADIGVAVSAYFPDLTLTGASGLAGTELSGLISAANVLWEFGASAPETVFQGGFRSAAVRAARASYRQAVATYRQTVLTAFQQVDDQLIALRMLAREEEQDRKAWLALADDERIVSNQYRTGTASITDVLVAQQNALAARRTLVTAQGGRLVAAVTLIEALGGGWERERTAEAVTTGSAAALDSASASLCGRRQGPCRRSGSCGLRRSAPESPGPSAPASHVRRGAITVAALCRAPGTPDARGLQHHELVVGPLGRGEGVLEEAKVAVFGMSEGAHAALAVEHALLLPGRREKCAVTTKPGDQVAEPRIVQAAAEIGAKLRQQPPGSLRPVGQEIANGRIEEHVAQEVAFAAFP